MTANARLELTWPNKDKFLLAPSGSDGKPVWVERDHPAAHEVRLSEFTGALGEVNKVDPYADNLLFTGDSLDVLRILCEVPEYRKHYRGKIKLIYIDPPFNTGQTFTHYDDWMEHSTWLSFMRDRLTLMRELLAPDGSIWVHLDDAEVHRMRCLMDEVLGERSFVTTVAWQKRTTRENRAAFSSSHDHLLVYSRGAPTRWRDVRNALPNDGEGYSNPDGDPRGPWASVPFTAPGFRSNQMYEIVSPTGVVHVPPRGRCWGATEPVYEQYLAENRVYFPSGGDGKPRIKQFLSEASGLVPATLWPATEVGVNDEAKRHLMNLFPGLDDVFSTPKPERLLERVIHIASNPGDIVVDVFGGSGSTAAVAQKTGRRWVTAEILPETVEAFTRPRLEKVVAGGDPGGITESVGWAGGGGFRCVEVGPSMYEVDEDLVLLAPWATNGKFAKAVAGQLGFEWQSKKHAPFCGVRGRMRLAVLDGAVGPEEAREITAALGDGERVTIVAKVVLPGAEEVFRELSRGSRIRKAPRDLLVDSSRKARRGGAR